MICLSPLSRKFKISSHRGWTGRPGARPAVVGTTLRSLQVPLNPGAALSSHEVGLQVARKESRNKLNIQHVLAATAFKLIMIIIVIRETCNPLHHSRRDKLQSLSLQMVLLAPPLELVPPIYLRSEILHRPAVHVLCRCHVVQNSSLGSCFPRLDK